MYIIIIYHDGSYIVKSDLEIAFTLPGNYFVFSKGNDCDFNQKHGVCYYNNNREIDKFRINNLELIDIKFIKYPNPSKFRFSVYDHKSDTVIKIEETTDQFINALISTIMQIISASQYPNWETYGKVIKIEEYKLEIKGLNEQIDILKKQNEELTAGINFVKNPST